MAQCSGRLPYWFCTYSAPGYASRSSLTTPRLALYLAASWSGVLLLLFRASAALGCALINARITASFAWLWAARCSGRCPRCVLTLAAPGFSSASVLMSRFVAYVFCAATCRGVLFSLSWTDAASGDPMARTVAMLWLTPGCAAARWRGVAPKLFVMLLAAFASGWRMSSLEIWGGASNSAQQWSGVSFSRFVASIGDVDSPSDDELREDDDVRDLPWSCMRTSTIFKRFLSILPDDQSPSPPAVDPRLAAPDDDPFPPPPSSTIIALLTAR